MSEFNREWVRAVVGNVRDALNAKISWLWDEVVKVQTANAALKTDIVNLRSVNAALQVELESLRDRVDALEAPSPPPEPTPDPNIPM